MPKIKKLSELLMEDPKLEETKRKNPRFNLGWSSTEVELPGGTKLVTGLESPRFGRVERVVVCDDNGVPLFDQYQIEEGPADQQGKRPLSSGSVIVPYFQQDGIYVGLLSRVRELVIDPETSDQGRYVAIELPRGFGRLAELPEDTAVRELGEETSKVAKRLVRLGRVNPNTAFYVTPGVPTFAAEVDPLITGYLKPESREPILRCEFLPYVEVRRRVGSQAIYCALTLSGLMLFDTYLEQNKLK